MRHGLEAKARRKSAEFSIKEGKTQTLCNRIKQAGKRGATAMALKQRENKLLRQNRNLYMRCLLTSSQQRVAEKDQGPQRHHS